MGKIITVVDNLVKQNDPVEVRVKEPPVAGRRAGSGTPVEEHHRLQGRSRGRSTSEKLDRLRARVWPGSATRGIRKHNKSDGSSS